MRRCKSIIEVGAEEVQCEREVPGTDDTTLAHHRGTHQAEVRARALYGELATDTTATVVW